MLQLSFNRLPAPFKYMHRHVGRFAILQFQGSVPYLRQLIRRQQAHTVDQNQIRHTLILAQTRPDALCCGEAGLNPFPDRRIYTGEAYELRNP